jgi:hypothetical protein
MFSSGYGKETVKGPGFELSPERADHDPEDKSRQNTDKNGA